MGRAGSVVSRRRALEVRGDVELAVRDVEGDRVTVADERDRAALHGLRRDVTGHEPVGRAAEATVGHERDRVAEPLADERGGDAEHLAHPRTAARAFVPDDDHVTRLHALLLHGREGRLLTVEDARGAGVLVAIVAGELHDAALGRERPAEDREAAARLERLGHGTEDGRSLGPLARLGRLLAERAAGARGRVLQEPCLEHALREEAHAAGARHVDGREAAAGLEIAEHRRARGDRVEVVDHERHVHLARDGEEVEDGVGGAGAGGDRRDGVLEGGAREEVARTEILRDHLHDELAGAARLVVLLRVVGGDLVGAHRRQAEHRDGDRHRVGGELAAACARAGAGVVLEDGEPRSAHLARGVRADGLEDVLDGDVVILEPAGRGGAAVEHHARHVEACERHHGAGDGLVAARERDHAVEEMATSRRARSSRR